MACRIILSAPVPFLFLRTLDLGFGIWIWDIDLGLGFMTWIWDLDLGLGFGLDLGLTIIGIFEFVLVYVNYVYLHNCTCRPYEISDCSTMRQGESSEQGRLCSSYWGSWPGLPYDDSLQLKVFYISAEQI